jgi:hypothetical protein
MPANHVSAWRCLVAGWAIALLACGPARAINISMNYQYDTGNFFPVGSQARAAMNAAASFYSGILQDTFSAVTMPAPFTGSNGSVATWSSIMDIPHPSANQNVRITNIALAADEYRVYVGARDLEDDVLGEGAAGPTPVYGPSSPGTFTTAEHTQINQITENFGNSLTRRGETGGFARWGGLLTFNSVDPIWHFNHTTAPPPGTSDFYSVALHELAHTLGFGQPGEWANLASGAAFAGSAAAASYGSAPLLEGINSTGRRSHWKADTMSRVFGTNTVQEALMDPNITVGTRKLVTSLDAAALIDIGWTITEPPPPLFLPADFNHDGTVNGPDLATWRSAFRLTTAGNADGDGDSDGNDFLIWQRTLGQHTAGAAAASVPEPGGVVLAFAWALMLRRRRGTAGQIAAKAAIEGPECSVNRKRTSNRPR